jgi:hypothetical protein
MSHKNPSGPDLSQFGDMAKPIAASLPREADDSAVDGKP